MSADGAGALPALDIDWVRAQFPAFSDPDGAETVFMENAGGSYAARHTIERLTDFYIRSKVQPYSAFPASARAGRLMDEGRGRLAEMLGVGEDELIVGPSTTQNAYVLAQAFGEMLEQGDEIVVTNQDHEANTGAWRRLADRGIVVKEWEVDATGRLDPDRLRAVMSPRTKLVTFPHASNIVAEINPVAEIAAIAHAGGAVVCVDGVSAAPHGLPHVPSLGADIYLFSTYKTYGPHQGVMAIRRGLNRRLPNQGHGFNDAYLTKRLCPAGPDHAQIAALAGIADYIDAVYAHHIRGNEGPAERSAAVARMMRMREAALTERLMAFLDTRADLTMLGPRDAERREPTVALVHARPAGELADALAEHGVGAGGSSFYSPRVIRALGHDPEHGVLRLSFLHYTTEEEIDRTCRALEAVL
ncbi:MAG: aminotransferase class V-fold PLP-dependent enzyme [Pseudomonadota bacterium]